MEVAADGDAIVATMPVGAPGPAPGAENLLGRVHPARSWVSTARWLHDEQGAGRAGSLKVMSSDIDFDAFLRQLRAHPEWREELRRVLDEGRPDVASELAQLAVAQRRTDEHLETLTVRVDALAEQVEALAGQVEALARRMDALAVAQERTEQALGRLINQVDELRGDVVERRYRDRGHAHFGPIARRLRPLSLADLDRILDQAVADGVLDPEQSEDVRLADGVFRGRRRSDDAECFLVLEASAGVGPDDVRRAWGRADALARTGVPSLPVVAGDWITPAGEAAAREFGVWQVTDGHVVPPGPGGADPARGAA